MDQHDTSPSRSGTTVGATSAEGEAIVGEAFDPLVDEAPGDAASAMAARAGQTGDEAPGGEGDSAGAEPSPAEPTAAEQLAAAREATERTRQQLLRVAADFDNFRKRTARDLDDAQRRARHGVVRELLPVFDNLERAGAHVGEAADAAAVADGIRMVLRQFLDTLRRLGIERVEAEGRPFDPAIHESIQLVESAEVPAGFVVGVVQAGYRHGDGLIRPALVAVSKGPPASGDAPGASAAATSGGGAEPGQGGDGA